MFVLVFPDGKFLKNTGKDYICNVYCKEWTFYDDELYYHPYVTNNINEALILMTLQACRSSNAYSWGARPKQVTVTINLVE